MSAVLLDEGTGIDQRSADITLAAAANSIGVALSPVAANVHVWKAMAIWPYLPYEAWAPTKETLHRYTQLIGKIQLALTPVENHFWNVALRLTARGLATTALRYEERLFDIELDLVEHELVVRTSDREKVTRELRPLPVAEFRAELFDVLDGLGIFVKIWDHPVELRSEPIDFSFDRVHAAYDRAHVTRFFHVLGNAHDVMEAFRTRFIGKCSGVGFYWGTFDLAVAFFSGRRVPAEPTGSVIDRETFTHELIEVGFWPGDVTYPAPAFYAMQFPQPEGYAQAIIRPEEAHWEEATRCFVLPYEAARERGEVSTMAMQFFESTYDIGANLAGWHRDELERAAQPRGQHAA